MAAPRMTHTWDGLPIADDPPHGSTVVVLDPDERLLILHRATNGADYEGDWAWTPPSGARRPGEPLHGGALRELYEETGIIGADPRPVDLSGEWALFAADLPAGAAVRLDHEHDRFEWLGLDEAVARCAPARVGEGLRRAVRAAPAAVSFRPLTRADLPDMVAWRRAPHAARWFTENLDLTGAEAKYGPRIDGSHHVSVHVLLVDGRPSGFIQHYRVSDDAVYSAAVDLPGAIGIDYLIGVEQLTGRGIGPQVIWSYLRSVVLPAHRTAPYVVASPDPRNERSLRALEKAGFRRRHEIAVPHVERLCVLDVLRVLGPHAGFPVAPFRPAVRVLCLDASGRVLLLRWRDPYDGSFLWEPPGGGIEPGETPFQAAQRELTEETGLSRDAIGPSSVDVWRDVTWKGRRYIGTEQFFLARFEQESPSPGRAGLLPDEVESLTRHAWVHWSELGALPEHLEPPELMTVLTALAPSGPWAG